jgi:hypothetical protein
MAIKVSVDNFNLAQSSAVVLDAAMSSEIAIPGLQGMGLLLGFTMEEKEISEIGRRIALVVPSGGKYEPMTVDYNFTWNKVYERLRNASINSTKIASMRNYIKRGCDFSAPDFISDPGSGLFVGGVGDPKVDSPNGIWKGQLTMTAGGAFVYYVAHTGQDGTILSYVAATRTLSITGSSFVTLGFEANDSALFDFADSNDPLHLKIESVSSSDIVFAAGIGDVDTLASDFSGITTTQLHAATPLEVLGFGSTVDCS